MGLEKNTAGKWVVFAYGAPDHASSGLAITGDAANITANVRIDGGAANAVDDTNPTELEDGFYVFDITAAEANGDMVLIAPVSSTSDVIVIGAPAVVHTVPVNFNALGIESDGDVTKVNTLNGHTAQTGDNFANTGTPADTDIATDLVNISAKISNIGAASGGAVNFAPIEDNTGGTIDPSASAFVGSVVSGTYASIGAGVGASHSINDTGNNISIVYGYQVGGARVATTLSVFADVDGASDDVDAELYDHVGAQWVVMGNIDDDTQLNIAIEAKYTGTGSELGKVYLRFVNNATTPSNLEVWEGLIAAVNTSTSVGYAQGAYWIDSAGTSGQEIGINGTADQPCPWADAIAMNATQALNRFHIANGNSVTLSANSDAYSLFGEGGWTLALGGQSIEGASFWGATGSVTGTATATVTRPQFTDCHFGAVTLPPSVLDHCGVGVGSGTLTAGSAGNYDFHEIHSLVPGPASPAFAFSGLGSATNISNRGHLGGCTWTVDSDCTISQETLAGGGTTFNTDGADIEIRGICRSLTIAVTGTSGTTPAVRFVGTTGDVTLSGTSASGMTIDLFGVSNGVTGSITNCTTTDNTVSNESVNAQADTALSDYDGPTNTELLAAHTTTDALVTAVDTVVDAIKAVTDAIPDSGALTSIATASALATVDGIVDAILIDTGTTLPATLAGLNDFDPASDTVANVTLVATTTTNTDMRGTDSANTVVPDAAGTAATLVGALNDFNPASDAVANVTLVATTTTNTDMRGTNSALLAASAPTNFGSLGIETDGDLTKCNLVATTTTNTDMRGTDSALLAASVPTNFAALGIETDGDLTKCNLVATTTTNTDMRGTDSANTTVPDAAGTAAGLHTTTDAAIAALNDISVSDVWTTALTEAYRSTGAAGTAAEYIHELIAHLGEHANSGTTRTLKKLDGSTTAKTYTYDDATSPTSITEAT